MLGDNVDRGFQEFGPSARDPQYLPRSIHQLVQARVPAERVLLLLGANLEIRFGWGGKSGDFF